MKASEKELSQSFNIEETFGVDLSDSPRLIEEIGQAMLDRIRDRCEDDNKDIFGNKFEKYSKEYIKSDTFKDFNKSASDRDMTLTGRMLEDIDFKSSGSNITLEVTNNHGKSYNHQVGDKLPQRAWFGMGDKDMEHIKSLFSSDIERAKTKAVRPKRSVLDLATSRAVEAKTAEATFADLFGASGIDIDLGDF